MVSKNNWVKEAQNLYTENYTILLQEIKEDLNKWKDILCSWIGRVKVVQKATAGSADSFGFLLNVFLLPSLITISPLQYISFQTLWFSSLHVRLGPFFFFLTFSMYLLTVFTNGMQLEQMLSCALVIPILLSALGHFQMSDPSLQEGSFPPFVCIPQTVGWNARHCECYLAVCWIFLCFL